MESLRITCQEDISVQTVKDILEHLRGHQLRQDGNKGDGRRLQILTSHMSQTLRGSADAAPSSCEAGSVRLSCLGAVIVLPAQVCTLTLNLEP